MLHLDANIYPERLIQNPFQPQETKKDVTVKLEGAGNSSPDSGFHEDEEEDFPEWTELRSTLHLHPPVHAPPSPQNPQCRASKNPQSRATINPQSRATINPQIVQPPAAFVLEPKARQMCAPQAKTERNRKPVTLTSRIFNEINLDDVIMTTLPGELLVKETKCKFSSEGFHFASGELEEGFSDFLCDFENFESIPEVEFSYDDPFKMIWKSLSN